MSDSTEIPLYRSDPPGFRQVATWLLASNVFVVITVLLIVVVVPWLGGHQPALTTTTLVTAASITLILMIGFLLFANRRHQRRQLAEPRAKLVIDDATISLRRADGGRVQCEREAAIAEPVHATEKLRDVEYYLGPALRVQVGEVSLVIVRLDGARRWGHEPRAVHDIDWICSEAPWRSLLEVFELQDGLVASPAPQE